MWEPIVLRPALQAYLVNGPFINRTLLDQRYPPGVLLRNDGVVIA